MTAVPDRPDVTLLALYDRALPQVYGYLMGRCGDRAVAEDLTSETFLAVAAGRRDVDLTVGGPVALDRPAPQHRAVLTLRYLDGLSVPEAAAILHRSVGATEALLVRARPGPPVLRRSVP